MELTAEELIRDLGLDPVKNAETRFASCFQQERTLCQTCGGSDNYCS